MFIDKNINLALKSLFATQMTMFILYIFLSRCSDIFAKFAFRFEMNLFVLILDCSFCDEFATLGNFNALATSA